MIAKETLAQAGVVVLWLGVAAAAVSPTAARQQRMNVVFLADDLGVMDVGAYSPQTFYATPNLDAQARSRMRFTTGYAACPVCSPMHGEDRDASVGLRRPT